MIGKTCLDFFALGRKLKAGRMQKVLLLVSDTGVKHDDEHDHEGRDKEDEDEDVHHRPVADTSLPKPDRLLRRICSRNTLVLEDEMDDEEDAAVTVQAAFSPGHREAPLF